MMAKLVRLRLGGPVLGLAFATAPPVLVFTVLPGMPEPLRAALPCAWVLAVVLAITLVDRESRVDRCRHRLRARPGAPPAPRNGTVLR